MNKVWIVSTPDNSDIAVCSTAEKAYDYCKEIIKNCVAQEREEYMDRLINKLNKEYLEYPDSFACEDICWAKVVDVL